MTLNVLLTQLQDHPETTDFATVIATIEAHYTYTPQAFSNGSGDDYLLNAAGTNAGSCKIFAFGQLQALSEAQTLACFGEHYRKVLATPEGNDHANIRTFMRHGWVGVRFDQQALHRIQSAPNA